VHDTTNLEAEGRPAVFVASTEFIEAARAQSEALGFDPAAVYVPHPIQDRTDAELHALADAALAEILEQLTE
jgi:predicted negative regulator of RcsB-dependent stress response